MTDDVRRAVIPTSPPPFEHAHHERTLVLRYFEEDPELTREERLLASALLRTCPWCAALGPEAELIADANRAMIVPPAGRDFRITSRQARRARSFDLAAAAERIRAALRTELVRPLAGAAVAVGLVLAVVGAVPYLGNSSSGDGAGTQAISATATGSAFGADAPRSPEASPPIGETQATLPQADETPTVGTDTSAQSAPAPSSLRVTSPRATPSPSEMGPNVAFATVPGPSPAPGANSAGGGALNTQTNSGEAASTEPLPPLLIFGILIAIVGLLVLGLTVLARRVEPKSS